MSSVNRTYGRKRKDDAADKFDALFSSDLKKTITIHAGQAGQIKKQKKDNGEPNSIKLKNGTEVKFHSSVAVPKTVTKTQEVVILDSLSYSPKKSQKTKTFITDKSPKSGEAKPFHTYNSIANTKYDVLFKKNEKNASDKFDALFGDELGQTEVQPHRNPANDETVQKHPEYDNLFGFAESPRNDEQISVKSHPNAMKSIIDLHKVPSYSREKSPIKLSGITGASMRTIGGKVVLNIQKRTKSQRKTSIEQVKHSEISSKVANAKHSVPSPDIFSSTDEHISLFGNHKKAIFSSSTTNTKPFTSTSDINAKLRSTKPSLPSSQSVASVQPLSSSISLKKLSHSQTTFHRRPAVKSTYLSNNKQTSTSKASYNSRPWMQNSEESASDKDSFSQSQPDSYEFDSEEAVPKLTRSVTWPEQLGESIKTSLKCDKSVKAYFTVVKHVKNYQNCLEEGETQEFEDEVNYLLEGLQSSQPLSVRCLSVTNFASKCQQHNFRLYLRAHNIVDKVFSNLTDAKEHSALARSTAALLFMLSRDRQMEINKSTLQLLLRLLDPFDKDDPNSQKQESKQKEKDTESKYKFFKSKDKKKDDNDSLKASTESVAKIKHLIATSGDQLLSESDVSVKRLSSEALLRFTARRTVEWYREEIRIKGGLDHIISLVKQHVDALEAMSKEQPSETDFKPKTTLCILERLLKVLENGIVNSPRNAMYLVTHQRALLLKKLAIMMKLTQSWLSNAPPPVPSDETSAMQTYTVLQNSVLQIIKLLVNISNDNEWVSSRVGEQYGMLENIVDCVLTIPTLLKEEHRYELILLSLSLLVNLVESSAKNRISLMKMTLKTSSKTLDDSGTSVIRSLVQLFERREAAAKENEVLGETGVKKAVAAKKTNASNNDERDTTSSASKKDNDDGHWVETEDGMEWVPSENGDDVISASQDSCRSAMTNKNPESTLTAEERNEMKETLDKANEHMEDSIVASYAALVLGCLIHGNKANAAVIGSHFSPESGYPSMVRMLKKFLSFMSLTSGMSTKGEKTLTDIIEAVEEET